MKRALLLTSGGAKGAFEVGAVEHLIIERGMDFDVIAGTSTGCLNAAILAQGAGLEGLQWEARHLRGIWLGLEGRTDIYLPRLLSPLLFFFAQTSFFSTGPLRNLIQEHLDPERLRASGKELRIGVTDLQSGKFRPITQREEQIREYVLASASSPLAFPPVDVDGIQAVDGGVRQFQPMTIALAALNQLGTEDEEREVWCVLSDPLEAQPRRHTFDSGREIGWRLYNILPIEAFRLDFARALQTNRAVRAYLDARRALEALPDQARFAEALEHFPFRPPHYRVVKLFVIAPDHELMRPLDFDPEKIRRAYDLGRNAARNPIEEAELDRRIPQES